MISTDETPAISSPKLSASKRQSSCSVRTKLSAPQSPPNHHTILLLSDSALPLGSFAFSSGLESHLAHTTTTSSSYSSSAPSTLSNFLSLSLHSLCTTSLPHLLAAHSHPQHINEIDTIFDASTLCPVARRASIAQGRALLTLWDRAFRNSSGGGRDDEEEDEDDDDQEQQQQQQQQKHNNYYHDIKTSGAKKIKKRDIKYKEARDVLAKFSLALKKAFVIGGGGVSTTTTTTTITPAVAKSSTTTAAEQQKSNGITNNNDEKTDNFEEQEQQHYHHLETPNGHFPPLWGLVTQALRISARDSVYVFLLNHAKSVVSAAVRASLMGPYQAQGLLGSVWLRKELERLMDRAGVEEREEEEREEEEREEEGGVDADADADGWRRRVEEAGQGVPALDIWLGRHELLYSRIFNS